MPDLLTESTTEAGADPDTPARRAPRLPTARARGVPRGVRVLLGLQLAAALLFAGHALGLYGARSDVTWNQVVYEFGIVPATAVCGWRALTVAEDRPAWGLITFALVLYAAGDLSWWLVVHGNPSPPYPSVTDALYLSYYVPLLAGLVLLIRPRVDRLRRSKLLEGVVGGLTLASLAAAVTLDPDVASTRGAAAAVVTSLAYPSLDIVLLSILAGGLILQGARPAPAFGLLACGLVVATVSDCFLVLAVAGDGYLEGGPIDIGWPASMVLIGCAAWARPAGPTGTPARTGAREHVVAVVFGLLIAGLLLGSAVWTISPVAVVLLDLAVLALLAQLLVTTRERAQLATEREEMRAQLHDDALQYVLAARQDLVRVAHGDGDALPYAQSALESLTVELRRVMLDLAPNDVTPGSLEARVLEATADAARRGGFDLTVDLRAEVVGRHADLTFALVRELVGNAAKHAAARTVGVTAVRSGAWLRLTVTDDGRGFGAARREQAIRAGHIGLALASRRVEAAGGTLEVTTGEGRGTQVAILLPR